MPDIVVDTRGIRPIAFDGDKAKALLYDQFARDPLAHPIEFRGSMRRFAEQHDACIADSFKQRAEIDCVDRVEWLSCAPQLF